MGVHAIDVEDGGDPSNRKRSLYYVQGELLSLEVPVLPRPNIARGNTFHVYCSPNNPSSLALIREVSVKMGLGVEVTSDGANMSQCEHFLVHLHRRTWTSGQQSDDFAAELREAMDNGVNVFLAHEMPKCAFTFS